jgi:hypothetical protein
MKSRNNCTYEWSGKIEQATGGLSVYPFPDTGHVIYYFRYSIIPLHENYRGDTTNDRI